MSDGYNQRLFSTGFRRWLHTARFRWLEKMSKKYSPDMSVVAELGCFDGRALNFIQEPVVYYGFDADWEQGLTSAREKYKDSNNYYFYKCVTPSEYRVSRAVTLFLSLETLEHIPVNLLGGYIERVSSTLANDAYLFISVPNEKGVLFIIKYFIKRFFLEGAEDYTPAELFWATMGRCHKVTRKEHKGFDWEILRDDLSFHFELIEYSGLQFPWLPCSLNASIGLVYKFSKS